MSEIEYIRPAEVTAVVQRKDEAFKPSLLEQLWRSILNHKWALLLLVMSCLILGLVATLFMTPEYTAASRIDISRKQENVTNVEGLEPDVPGIDQEFYETQYSLLQARSLADRVVRTLNLATNDSFFNTFGADPDSEGLLPTQRSAGGVTAQQRSARADLASTILLDNITIAPIRGSSLVDVRFTSPDPKLSAEIANVWVEQFIQANLDRRFESTQDAREYLESRLDQLRKKLEDSEQQLVNYAAAKQIVTLAQTRDSEGQTSEQETLTGTDLQAMDAALVDARATRIKAESDYRRGQGKTDALNNPAINEMRQKRAEVASERAGLLTQFESGYPAVQALTSQMADLDRSIAAEEARVRDTARAQYEQALGRELDLEQRVNALKNRFLGQTRDSIQYNIYQREVDTNRQLYQALLQRYKEIGVAGVGANNIAVVDQAEAPKIPSSPNMGLNMVIALLLGLTLGAVYVFAREQIDQNLRNPADVKEKLGLPLLGTVPNVAQDDLLDSLADPKSVISEAYFAIGTTLSFLTDHGVPQSILFTSTRPNEGKSTSTYALAMALARMQRKTLLIDADLRNPSVHDVLAVGNASGLTNVLNGSESLADVIQKTRHAGLMVVPAGPIPPNPAELLTGDRVSETVREALRSFDHVLIDAPPVLGLADVPLLARAVEGVIFTIEANSARFRTIQSALRRLETAHAHLFGAIVSKVDSRNAAYGYGEAYGYGYGYGANSGKASRKPA